ncbi:major facilitator superfamily domain-containing protein [Gamsiella multidivaricata]|uniref:major facilitator superfamily domain-containing protein n=1 Tax=Gamsiella multidivaricata TaxID=101098 RepID=UPI00221F13E0|nr:major facilitator superfamily domain-containing protein [Gamsiella multidivaricata]KAI7821204.1 major facilitator superfamily domain-containing protein [Gamsiella multidivaricata]
MLNIQEAPAAETTALLGGIPSGVAKPHEQRALTWYWPWQPNYWAAILIIFLSNLASGPTIALIVPSLKELFCERGIPTLFPVHNSTGRGNDGQASLAQLTGDLPNNDDGHCDSAEYSAAIANFVGISLTLTAILVALTIRYWSGLGDRMGRKRAMLIGVTGSAFSCTLAVLVRLNKGMSLYFLRLGNILDGATGSLALLETLAHAYASDVTRAEERTVVFGRLVAGEFAGLALGSILGGMVAKQFGLTAVFVWLNPALVILNIFCISMIPESLTVASLDNKRKQQIQSSFEQGEQDGCQNGSDPRNLEPFKDTEPHSQYLKALIKRLTPEQLPDRLAGEYSVLMLMITSFIALVAIIGVNSNISTYLLYRFRWSEARLSSVMAVIGLSRLVSLTFLLPRFKRLAPQDALTDPVASISFDLKLVVIGLLIESLTFFLYGATPVGEGFYLGGVLSSLGTMFSPAIRGIISQSVAPELLGETLGTLVTFEVLSAAVTPLLSGWFYGITLEIWPSALFYASGVLGLFSCALALSVFFSHMRITHDRV